MNDKKKDLYLLIDPGIPIIGQATGGVISSVVGFIFAGLPGAAVGGAGGAIVADLFSRYGKEIHQKYLSPRERIRVGATAFFAMEKIKNNIEDGKQVRNDDFFTKDVISDRSSADEILEGTLLASQREHEELKLRYLGNLCGNVAFIPDIDKYQANFLLRLSQNLSYRQLCLLSLFYQKHSFQFSEKNARGLYKNLDQNQISLYYEVEDLMTKNLIGCSSFLGQRFVILPKMELSKTGEALFSLMNLHQIPMKDLERIVATLNRNVM
ncbi:MAG: hypothetical protein WC626_08890 [Methanoregula sp.]